MGRLSTTKAPTESFCILLKHPDGGIKHKHRLKIVLICAGILLILAFIGTIIGLSVHLDSKSSVDKLTEDSSQNNETLTETTTTSSSSTPPPTTTATSTTTTTILTTIKDNKSNETLLLIGGKNSQNDFLNEIEVIGQEDCPRLEVLPQNDQNRTSLSTLTKDGYLVICTEYLDSIFCHASNGTSMDKQVPDLALVEKFSFTRGALSSSNSILTTHFRKDYHGITVKNDFIILKTESQKGSGSADYKQSIFRADTNSFLKSPQQWSPLISAYYKAQGSCSVTIQNTQNATYFLLIGGYNPRSRGQKVTTHVSLFKYNNGQITTPRLAKGKKVSSLVLTSCDNFCNFQSCFINIYP